MMQMPGLTTNAVPKLFETLSECKDAWNLVDVCITQHGFIRDCEENGPQRRA